MRKTALVWVLVLAFMLVAAPASAGNNGNDGDNGKATDKVWVCHHTHSYVKNPIVLIHVSKNAWLNGHHNKTASDHQTDDQLEAGDPVKAGPVGPGVACGSEGGGNNS